MLLLLVVEAHALHVAERVGQLGQVDAILTDCLRRCRRGCCRCFVNEIVEVVVDAQDVARVVEQRCRADLAAADDEQRR